MAAKFGFEPTAVPTIFIGDRYWVGYAKDPIGKEIEAHVGACLLSGCPDAGAGVLPPAPHRPASHAAQAPAAAVEHQPVPAAPRRVRPGRQLRPSRAAR